MLVKTVAFGNFGGSHGNAALQPAIFFRLCGRRRGGAAWHAARYAVVGCCTGSAFEQLGGTEVPNPVFDNVLTIARETLTILLNMVPL